MIYLGKHEQGKNSQNVYTLSKYPHFDPANNHEDEGVYDLNTDYPEGRAVYISDNGAQLCVQFNNIDHIRFIIRNIGRIDIENDWIQLQNAI